MCASPRRGNGHDACPRKIGQYAARHFFPGNVRQQEIKGDHIGPIQPKKMQRLRARCSLGHHLHAVLFADDRGKALPHQWLLVYREDSDGCVSASGSPSVFDCF
jgi:hypothetical protein